MFLETYYSAQGCRVTTTAKPRNSVARVVAIDDGIYSRATRCSSKMLAGRGRGDNGGVRVEYAGGPSNATAVGDARI